MVMRLRSVIGMDYLHALLADNLPVLMVFSPLAAQVVMVIMVWAHVLPGRLYWGGAHADIS